MNEDMYLNLAVELYEKGSWDKDVFIKRVMLYASEKNIDPKAIEQFIKRVIKEPEYTIEQKRKILSMITLDGVELKYGDAAHSMNDEMVEKFYELEEKALGKDKVSELLDFKNLIHDLDLNKSSDINNSSGEVVKQEIEEKKEEVVSPLNPITTHEVSDADEVVDSEPDMPETEEEFVEAAEKITSTEKDSAVKTVSVTPERLEKLKKSKGKIKNYFLKTAIIVVAVTFLAPIESIALIGGYCYFAEKIKNGTFNPENIVGKAVKKAVEKVMYLGMNKENEKDGKTKW